MVAAGGGYRPSDLLRNEVAASGPDRMPGDQVVWPKSGVESVTSTSS